jgi:hypothetical protein
MTRRKKTLFDLADMAAERATRAPEKSRYEGFAGIDMFYYGYRAGYLAGRRAERRAAKKRRDG